MGKRSSEDSFNSVGEEEINHQRRPLKGSRNTTTTIMEPEITSIQTGGSSSSGGRPARPTPTRVVPESSKPHAGKIGTNEKTTHKDVFLGTCMCVCM